MPSPLRIPRITRLRLPPRRVPLGLWCQAFLDPIALFQAAAFAVSILYILYICGDGMPGAAIALRHRGVAAPALVEKVETSSVRIAGLALARVTYSFQHPGGTQRLVTHDIASHWTPGTAAEALYLPGEPAVARLRGEKRPHPGVFSSALYLFPLAFFLFGIPAWRRTWLRALLLREGLAADAHIQKSELLRRGLRSYDLYRYDYEFESLWGEVFAGSSIANLDLPIKGGRVPKGARRSVLYLPRNATVSTLVDALPLRYRVEVDERGDWVARRSLPAILIVGAVAFLLAAALTCIWLAVAGFLPDLGR